MPGLIEDARRTGGLGIDLTRDAYWCYEGGEYRRFASGLEGLLLSRPLLEGIVREEATGHSRWFERLLGELGFELWIGDPAEIKAKRVKKQKYDREDARLLLRLMRASPKSGYRVQRIGICGNCCGIGIGSCRCVRGS